MSCDPGTVRPGAWRHLSAVAALVGVVACSAPAANVAERRARANEALADPDRRDAALEELATLALTHDGDAGSASRLLSERSGEAVTSGRGAALGALVAAAEGDLRSEVEAWAVALVSEDPVATRVALVRLLDLADFVPRTRVDALAARADTWRGPLAPLAALLAVALRREELAPLHVELATVPERFPLSAFRDGRTTPLDAPLRERSTRHGSLALRNASSALARARVHVPAAPGGGYLLLGSDDALRLTLGDTLLLERDPTSGVPPVAMVIRLDGAIVPRILELHVATSRATARLQLVWAPSDPVAEPDSVTDDWLAVLADAQERGVRGDRDGLALALDRLSALAPELPDAALLAVRYDLAQEPGRVLSRLRQRGHAGAVRAVSERMSLGASAGATEAEAVIEELAAAADPRSALGRFRLLRDRGWEDLAAVALGRALRLAPEACEPARERMQYEWERRKLQGVGPAEGLPVGCERLAPIATAIARFESEVGRVERAEQLLRESARSAGDGAANGVLRLRLLERLGRQGESLGLARALAEAQPEELGAHLRLGDLRAAWGERERALAVWEHAVGLADGDLHDRIQLAAVGAGAVWEEFAPDVDAMLAEPAPDELLEGHPAALLVDYQTTVRFKDGSAIHHVHQVMRLMVPSAIEELGEVEVPQDAAILRAVTRKADGRTLEPPDITQKDTISFPELEAGDVIELAYISGSIPDPGLGGGWITEPFFFQQFEVPSWRSAYTVLLQDGLTGQHESHGEVRAPETVTRPGFHGWRWVGQPRTAARPEPGAVAPFDELPRVQVWSGVGWPALLAYIREGLLGLTAADHRMRTLVEELPAGDGDALARARAVYGWVMREIEDRDDVYLSVPAREAVQQGQGERVVVLLALLRAAGYEAELAMIDPVHRHHAPSAVPDVRDFSYLAVRVRVPSTDEHLWLDPTFDGARFGFLAPTVRNRPAWIVALDGVDTQTQVVTPRSAPYDERRVVDLRVTVEADGRLHGQWHERAAGMDALSYRHGLTRIPEEQWRRVVAEVFQEVLPGVRVTALTIDGLDAPGEPVVLRAELDLPPATAGPNRQRSIRIGLLPAFMTLRWIHGRRRHTPLYADRWEELDLTVRLELAPGVTLTSRLPAPVVQRARFGSYRRTAERAGRSIVLRKQLTMNPQIVPPAGYDLFRRWCRHVDDADRVTLKLALSEPGPTSGAAAP